MKPITPKEAKAQKPNSFPPEVIEAFNELIVQNLKGDYACIRQKEVLALIRKKMKKTSADKICEEGWLDVEDVYRKAGWEVIYDAPGYNESFYEPSFEFRIKNKRMI